MPKDISLSIFHFSTTCSFLLKPNSESAKRTKSSLNRSSGILISLPSTGDKLNSTLSKISLLNILNRIGEIGHPCQTPLLTVNFGDLRFTIFTIVFLCL
ncbi:hypothetical protein AYI68_g2110 [Smittium mucronatum]|uniref:Uncharacterized protein n=1 Tax=Smittium mucronatum TaxID=133383 RepID=A0A1R0H3I9_9FUNG|nr:hypothetical protein AYI68_g2110 [Smittium mucronatum]